MKMGVIGDIYVHIRCELYCWNQNRGARRDTRRWLRLCKKLEHKSCPRTFEEYEEIRKMFVRYMKRTKMWGEEFLYVKSCVQPCPTVEVAWKNFIARLNYSYDRMNWRNVLILSRYLSEMEMLLLEND